MYCNYAGCDCIVTDQIEDGCNDCELRLAAKDKIVSEHLQRYVSFDLARQIANEFFSVASDITCTDFAYRAMLGSVTLQILREVNVPGQVYCRVFVLHKPVGYFNYDIKKGRKSRLWKED